MLILLEQAGISIPVTYKLPRQYGNKTKERILNNLDDPLEAHRRIRPDRQIKLGKDVKHLNRTNPWMQDRRPTSPSGIRLAENGLYHAPKQACQLSLVYIRRFKGESKRATKNCRV